MNEKEQLLMLLENKTLFENWLNSHSPSDEVGISIAAHHCPVFNFLKSNKFPIYGITPSLAWITEKVCYELPEWTTTFIRCLDNTPNESISAAKALKILTQLSIT
jgi:hypothetical protein